MRMLRSVSLVLAVLALALAAHADSATGTLYYTTFAGGTNVWSVSYNYNGTTFTLGASNGIAATNGADGLLFAPDGNIVIAGQGSGDLHEITTAGAAVNTVASGTGAYHLALSSNSSTAILYTLWNGFGGGGTTAIGATTLSGGGLSANGVSYTVVCANPAGCNTDVRGLVFNPNNSTWYYGTAPDGGSGDFGTVSFNNTTHVATLTVLKTGMFAHGLSFDPFTGNIIVNSSNVVQQLDNSGNIVSQFTIGGCCYQFDQASEDGQGHIFVASNYGSLLFIDYDATGKIGDPSNFFATPFLANALDDIAPIAGIGGSNNQVPEPGSLVLLGSGLIGIAGAIRRKLGV